MRDRAAEGILRGRSEVAGGIQRRGVEFNTLHHAANKARHKLAADMRARGASLPGKLTGAGVRITRDAFQMLVSEALDQLPAEFAAKLDGVEVIVEDEPTPEDIGRRQLPPGALILGIYRGIPLTERSVFRGFEMPHRIAIFQRSIEAITHTPAEMVREVRRTVLHEIAHHFGISDLRLRELGY